MTDFGASFKKARESKGISLDRIAAETRISTRFLRAIETEEFHLLPGGIFNRGFVRAYAEKVGLDPDQAVAHYERLTEVRTPIEATAASPQTSKRDRHVYPLAIGGLVLLILIFYVVTKEPPKSAETVNPPAPASPPVAQPAPTVPVVAPTSTPPPAPPTTPPEVTSAAPEPAPVAPAEALRVDIEAKETSWIKVKADGTTVVAGEILGPGMARHFTAQTSLYLAVGNAGGLVVKINDMPAKILGKPGQVLQVAITPENIKTFVE